MYEVASIEDYVRCMLEEAGLPHGCAPVDVVGHGQSGDLIATVGPCVVKFAPGDHPGSAETLAREAQVVRWLGGRVRVAANLWSGAFEGGFCLISERLHGQAVSHVGPHDAADAPVHRGLDQPRLHGDRAPHGVEGFRAEALGDRPRDREERRRERQRLSSAGSCRPRRRRRSRWS